MRAMAVHRSKHSTHLKASVCWVERLGWRRLGCACGSSYGRHVAPGSLVCMRHTRVLHRAFHALVRRGLLLKPRELSSGSRDAPPDCTAGAQALALRGMAQRTQCTVQTCAWCADDYKEKKKATSI